ncbi:KN motif and ankyrin repeat domain-containing protein 1-like [Polymixia lowei]
MAQESYIFRDGSGHSGKSSEECEPYYLETAHGYQLDLDHFKCVDDFQNGTTIKRLSLKRRPRVATKNVEKPQNDASPGQWTSSESLSSASSDDVRLLAMPSMTRGRPPLPPPHGSSLDTTPSRNDEGSTASQKPPESKPLPVARPLALPRHNPLVDKTLMETRRRLEQERTTQSQPEPPPRRRLASFGGVSSTGSLSPFTGLGAYNQNNNGNKPPGTGGELSVHLSSSLGNRGSTGSLRLSPQNSGRCTPAGLSPMHLQHVRDQMVVALQRLKEMEEQVKTIPILQVKISVLQEEKRQLVSQFKNQNNNQYLNDVFRKRAQSMGSSEHFPKVSEVENNLKTEEGLKQSDCTGLKEFRKLTEEMQALERTIKGGRLQAQYELNHSTLQVRPTKSVAVGTDEDTDTILSKPTKENKYAFVDTELIETRSIATEVSEASLGIVTEWEAELEVQQQMVEALKERICQLEAELKETALQTEMSRLKLELQAAEARNRVDKVFTAGPSTENTGTEAMAHTRSLGVGDHKEITGASTGERTEVKVCTVGVSCRPQIRSVSTGPDLPMIHWEVRERVECRDQCVGVEVMTNTQGVWTEMKMCDAWTNTDITMDNVGSAQRQIEYRSVACGDCSIDVTIGERKEMVSHGMVTDPIRGVDLGIMALPHTASQRTNTVSNSVSRFTNTRRAFNTNSSTNTVLTTQEKHTNTTQSFTRTVSVGNTVRDIQSTLETRSVGIGTAACVESALKPTAVAKVITRDTGVGFTNINENFLIGRKTRNMACGPSHLPDPTKTRSIGVGEGKIRNFSISSQNAAQTSQHSTQSQWDPDLNHYIEKMHRLLREQQGLLTENYSELGEVFDQEHSGLGNVSSRLPCINTAMTQRGSDVPPLQSQSIANRQFQSTSHLSNDSSKSDKAKSGICQPSFIDSGVKRKIRMMEQHAASALQDRPASANTLQSIMKKENGDQGCSNRKSLKFMRVTTGLEPMSTYEPSTCGNVNSEETEWKANTKWKGVPGMSDQGDIMTSDNPQRFKISEKMFSACQALRAHLSDDKALSSRELHVCLHTLQQEWFSLSSQKAANPAMVEDYLSAFRDISPSVLHHVANMADGNGNTVLHYNVSHSNFSVVKKMLDAGVCNVNQQNKAGYTPVMLAALAAVETPEDMSVVEELFTKGDVNAKASQAGQTALMLAVSHGRMDMVQALLAQGAKVNLQDDEGSTALMCASEHGHTDIVKLLLLQPDCDATLSDSDESTALSVALEAGHNGIALLLYAHANFSRGQAGGTARLGGKSVPCPGGKGVLE